MRGHRPTSPQRTWERDDGLANRHPTGPTRTQVVEHSAQDDPPRSAHDRRQQPVPGRAGLPFDGVPHRRGVVVRDHLVDVRQSPAERHQVERESFFLTHEEDHVVEPAGVQVGTPADDRTAGEEPEDRRPREVVGPTQG
jgi:hypothetical protein